jgi:hypothetical protein
MLIFGVGTPITRLVIGGGAVVAIPAVYTIKRAAWRIARPVLMTNCA